MFAALAAVTGCTDGNRSSPQCQRICSLAASCVEVGNDEDKGDDIAFDQSECVAACSVLEADKQVGVPLVEKQRQCIDTADDCEAMRECAVADPVEPPT